MHRPQVVKARSPRKGMFQGHSMTAPFGGHRQQQQQQQQVETTHPSNGVACSRTTGFYLNPVPPQQQPQQQQFEDEEMVWHDGSPSRSTAAIPGASHFYPSNNFPLPPHLWCDGLLLHRYIVSMDYYARYQLGFNLGSLLPYNYSPLREAKMQKWFNETYLYRVHIANNLSPPTFLRVAFLVVRKKKELLPTNINFPLSNVLLFFTICGYLVLGF